MATRVAAPSNSRLPNRELLPLLRRAATAPPTPPSTPAGALPPPRPSSASPGGGASRSHGGGWLPACRERPRARPTSPHGAPAPLPLTTTTTTTAPPPPARPPQRLPERSRLNAAGASQARRGGRSRPHPLPSRVPALPAVLTGVVVGRRRPRTTGPREQRAGSVRWRPTWLPRARRGRSPPPRGGAERFRGGGGGGGTGAIMQKIKSLMTRQVSGGGRRAAGSRALPGDAVAGHPARGVPVAGAGVCGRARAP